MKTDISSHLLTIEKAFREVGEIDVFIKPNQQIGGRLKFVHAYSCTIWPEKGTISINENFENGFIQASGLMQFCNEFRKAGFKPSGEQWDKTAVGEIDLDVNSIRQNNIQEKDNFFEAPLNLATLEFALYFLKTRNVKVIPAEKNMVQCYKCGIYQPIGDMVKTKKGYNCGCDKMFKEEE